MLLVAAAAAFFFWRFVLYQYSGRARFANLIAAVIVAAFGAGAVSYRLVREPAPIAVAQSQSPAAPSPAATVAPLQAHAFFLGRGAARHLARPDGPAPALGNLDRLSSGSDSTPAQRFPSGTTIRAVGWAANAAKSRAADVVLLIDGRNPRDFIRDYGIARADVANAYASPAMQSTGFNGLLSTAGLARGDHQVQIAVVSADGNHYALVDKAWQFTLY